MRKAFCTGLIVTGVLAAATSVAAQDQAQIEAGEQLYEEHCASCHGEKLRSTGAIPDLRELGAGDRARFDKAVLEGRGQMPPWQGVLSPQEFDQLWAYIRRYAR
jgi:quinohemoprotein ethanol dehydrogenase